MAKLIARRLDHITAEVIQSGSQPDRFLWACSQGHVGPLTSKVKAFEGLAKHEH